MSLRDQLLKSGLASKQQAKKAERESKKRQHEELKAKKDGGDETAPETSSQQEAIAILEAQRAADRERSRLLELERHEKEAQSRAIDIMLHHDLSEARAPLPYYFVLPSGRIGCLRVNELQQVQLAQGQLAIASFDEGERVYLVSTESADKIRACGAAYIICHHTTERQETTPSKELQH